jgi:hypothetical protein
MIPIKYRVRRSFFGKAILQEGHDGPSLLGGTVDASRRKTYWRDVEFDDLVKSVDIKLS